MRRISIEQQNFAMDITSRRAQLKIRFPKPQMTQSVTPSQLNIQHKNASFRLDWVSARRNQGQYSPMEIAPRFAAESSQAAMQGTGRIASEGDRMMQIYNPNDPVAEIAIQNMKRNIPTVNVRADPIPMPNVEWDTGGVKIEFRPEKLHINWSTPKLEIEVEPHDVAMKVRQYAEVKISAENDWPNRLIGNALNILA